mmetsp:Transcript_5916/g.16075  ORF Transcript_5916/g.16075 Transcript_5916/m.16075 type:complete len:254 (-) Transcript_5916:770-1531(-)|eukprot:CAMPEP_0198123856 /NCGR_PEP_ID=MMETSP1442-20131203/38526_1 /TAXON_ID= /ORGANISM="Craspedostauros australis, Strain CCMP3328" /LENGTH=253 /DNA_ID=CAMNT_0043783135 /DNA_START=111 /DNA_END=872 /DNA_ORIENTATION=+
MGFFANLSPNRKKRKGKSKGKAKHNTNDLGDVAGSSSADQAPITTASTLSASGSARSSHKLSKSSRAKVAKRGRNSSGQADGTENEPTESSANFEEDHKHRKSSLHDTEGEHEQQQQQHANENLTTTSAADSADASRDHGVENHCEAPAKPQLSWKESLLENQKTRECEAMLVGRFIKNQRVTYFHKRTEVWYHDAYVLAVHLDDGPDNPYYTIRYIKETRSGYSQMMEKQTTRDRLQYVLWDDDKSWQLLNP